jgi:DNA-binding CsgD family transcriptional regulator
MHPLPETPAAPATLRGRDRELAVLDGLITRARGGASSALVVAGDAGVGKTALLDRAAEHAAPRVRVVRMVASESEMGLPYAGLQLLCGSLMDVADRLPAAQSEALEAAFGLRDAQTAPNPFLVGLAVLGLLGAAARTAGSVLVLADDAQWLDDVSARALAFAARRLDEDRGVALVLAMRAVDERFADLPQLVVVGLQDDDARELLRLALPGAIDARVRDQLLAEADGNPLALQELPRALSRDQLAGGYALAASMPLAHRIEESLLAGLAPLPAPARTLLLVAAADPTGDPGLLWRACAVLGIAQEQAEAAERAGALITTGARVGFRHPLVRSAVYRAATPEDRRRAHAALAEATDPDRDPDRRAWHRAAATLRPDEPVAAALEASAARARTRGGVAAAAAFLTRAAELTPAAPRRAQRLIDAAGAKHDAGAPAAALRLLDSARDHPLSPLQQARIARLRARAQYALHRDRAALRALLAAAQDLAPLDPVLARDTYMEALAAIAYAGRLADPGVVDDVAQAILVATKDDDSPRARDLILRGQALLVAQGTAAAQPTLRRAFHAFLTQEPDALELRWMWFGGRAAMDVYDVEEWRTLTRRQVGLARATGVLSVLPMALNLQMVVHVFDGDLDAAEATCDEIDAILEVTGHPLPRYGRIYLAAYRGQLAEVERAAAEIRADAEVRGEGYGLTAANFSLALAYNGVGRYADAVEAARRELPYERELHHAMRALLELIEAAVRAGERPLAQEALARFRTVTEPADTEWSRAMLAYASAQLADDEQAEALYEQAIAGFDAVRVPMLRARAQLLYGEMLRRRHRRVDARAQLRPAYETLAACGMNAFAQRAARELAATGETLRARAPDGADRLTDQERNVAQLAREGLTNRDIGARLFISSRTAEYHLRKVYVKLGIGSREELRTALEEVA